MAKSNISEKVYEAADLPFTEVSSADFLSGSSTAEIRKRIKAVINTEAPVTEWLLIKRVINSFGIYKAGSQIRPEMEAVISSMKLNCTQDGTGRVYWKPKQNPEAYSEYRIGGKYDVTCRDVQYICDIEIANAAASVLEEEALDYAALAKKTALKLGYTRMGSNVTEGMKRGIACALKTKRIRRSGDTYRR